MTKDAFEGTVASGIRQAYFQHGYSVEEVEVEVNAEWDEPLNELWERELDKLNYPEVNQLLESDKLSHLTGKEQTVRIKKAWESGNADKAGALPSLKLRNNVDK